MDDSDNSFKFRFFTKEVVDEQYNKAIKDCQGLTSQKEIINKINKAFYNRIFLGFPFNESTPKVRVYRVIKPYPTIDIENPKDFSYNPKGPLNRANIEGFPVFYGSLELACALKEMKDYLKVGETFYVSEWLIEFKGLVNSHSLTINSKTVSTDSKTSKVAKTFLDFLNNESPYKKLPLKARDGAKQFLIKIGDLFTLTDKDSYYITSAYAHDVLYSSLEQGHDIPILMYPSITSEHNAINFAIHPRLADSDMMNLVHVMKLTVTSKGEDGALGTSLSDIGFITKDNRISWKRPTKSDIHILSDEFVIVTDNGTRFTGEDALSLCVDNTKVTVSDLFERDFDSLHKHMPSPSLKINEINESLNKPVYQSQTVVFKHGNQVMTPTGLSRINTISFSMIYTSCYN